MSGLDGSRAEWQKALRNAADFFHSNKTYPANLFLHTSGYESFITYMREVNFESLKGIAERFCGNGSVDTMTVMYIRLYVLGTVQFTCEWILGRIEATTEELALLLTPEYPPERLRKYRTKTACFLWGKTSAATWMHSRRWATNRNR